MDAYEVDLLRKLEKIKDIRTKSLQLEKVRSKLRGEFEATENEERCLAEYRAEMELLQQEKMAHVEELRLIHADINLMEATIKQAEEERSKALDSAKHLYEEHAIIRDQLDSLRAGVGLDRVSDSSCAQDERIAYELFEKHESHPPKLDFSHHPHHPSMPGSLLDPRGGSGGGPAPLPFPQSLAAALGGGAAPLHPVPSRPTPSKPEQRHSPGNSGVGVTGVGMGNGLGGGVVGGAGGGTFRQQPPPMKACLSCHQQIHRNAPICPLCKAKSRSRNPKKPKRKLDERD